MDLGLGPSENRWDMQGLGEVGTASRFIAPALSL